MRLMELKALQSAPISQGIKTDNLVDINRLDSSFWTNGNSDGGVDENFIPFYGIRMIAGRNFLPDQPSNHRSIIISRRTAEKIGLDPGSAVGKIVNVGRANWSDLTLPAEIIGVIEDYKHKPLLLEAGVSRANDGFILTYGDSIVFHNLPAKVSIRVNPLKFKGTISAIEELYGQVFPSHVFNWYFLDDHINQHYENERIVRNQIILFTCIAVGISCLGLLGMISNKVVEKTKEIGIRKILGAKVYQIAQILLNTTLKQVMIATIIGIPLAYYLGQQYLEKFSERISLQWWHYLIPLVILITIMFVTISIVLLKAVRTNPVESLRYE